MAIEKKAVDFSRLLRESEALVAHIDPQGMPGIQRSMAQLDAQSRRLAARAQPKIDTYSDAQAQMFFATKGLDLVKQERLISSIDLNAAFAALEPLSELDVGKFLDHHYQLTFASAIEEATQLAAMNARQHYMHRVESDWEQAKRDLLDQFGHRLGLEGIAKTFRQEQDVEMRPSLGFGTAQTALSRSIGAVRALVKTAMTYEQEAYAKVVAALAEARRNKQAYALVSAFATAARHIERQGAPSGTEGEVVELWQLLRSILREQDPHSASPSYFTAPGDRPLDASDRAAYREGRLSTSRAACELRQKLAYGARKHLEAQYLDYISAELEADRLAYALSSGGLVADIKAFLKLKEKEWPQHFVATAEGYPLWAIMFYCWRCGRLDEALNVAKTEGHQHVSGVFLSCLQRRVEQLQQNAVAIQGLPTELWRELNNEYNKELLNVPNADPYKAAFYQLLGRFQPADGVDIKPYATPTTEDWLWFQLSLIWESAEPRPAWHTTAGLELKSLQDNLLQLPSSQFDKGGREPLHYLKLLLTVQLFEEAVHYASGYLPVLAVHIALALDYYGMFRRGSGINASSEFEEPTVNYVRMIRKYTETFARTHPIEAFHYLCTLKARSPTGASLSSMGLESKRSGGFSAPSTALIQYPASASFIGIAAEPDPADDAIAELLVATPDWGQLIGTIDSNLRVQKNGLLYLSFSEQEATDILKLAAKKAENAGNHSAAVHFHLLAEDLESAAAIFVNQLSSLATSHVESEARKSFLEKAKAFIRSSQVLSRARMPADEGNQLPVLAASIENLLTLAEVFDLCQAGSERLDEALAAIERLGVFPLRTDEAAVQAERFSRMDASVQGCIGDLLVAVMEMYARKDRAVKDELARSALPVAGLLRGTQTPRDANRRKTLSDLREKARALVSFAGRLQGRFISPAVTRRLLDLEGTIG